MSNKASLVAGGLGGSLPVVVQLINADPTTIFSSFDVMVFSGFIVRFIFLVGLGILFVWINSETDKTKAFQLGIMAPALVVVFLNGSNLSDARKELSVARKELQFRMMDQIPPDEATKQPNASDTGFLFSVIGDAHAQPTQSDVKLKGVHRDPTALSRFAYGFSGQNNNGWFVIVGSHRTLEAANLQILELKKMGYDAQVFDRFATNSYYGVMIGSWLSLSEAQALRSEAVGDGLPRDTYLWSFSP